MDKLKGNVSMKAILEDTRPMDEGLRTTRSAKVISVIETESIRGNGKEKNPIRVVRQYWSLDGELLAENDENSFRKIKGSYERKGE